MNLQAVVSNVRSFSELLPIAESATPQFSFWGSRSVTVAGYEGSIDIDDLASRTMDLLHQFNFEFSLAEHEAGKRLAARIDRIYDEQGREIGESHCFTRTLFILRNLPCAIFNYLVYGDRGVFWKWRGQEQSNGSFNYYTRTQFQEKFGIPPEEAERRGLARHSRGWPPGAFPELWTAEEQILLGRQRTGPYVHIIEQNI